MEADFLKSSHKCILIVAYVCMYLSTCEKFIDTT